jgi:hypothetical protein
MNRCTAGSEKGGAIGLGLLAVAVVFAATSASAQVNQTQHLDGWILAAAHAPGLEGSIWRTDLWFIVDNAGSGSVTLRFCPSATDNTAATEYTVDVTGGRLMFFFEDVVDHFLGVGSGSWVGAIHYTSSTPIQVWARVYSINPAGTESYGQIVEGIPTADMSPDQPADPNADVHQWLYAVRHTADGRFRVNIGVVNPTAVAGDYQVRVFDETGNNPPGGSVFETVTVPPFSMVQLRDPFAGMMGGEWNEVMIRVVNYAPGSGNFAYASVVDNATNDAFFVRGVKRLAPDQ